jgi:hypothetical protein
LLPAATRSVDSILALAANIAKRRQQLREVIEMTTDQRDKADEQRREQTEKRWRRAAVLGTWANVLARLLEVILHDRV